MIVVQRKVRGKQSRTQQCSAPGCIHSARFDAVLLGTEFTPLCGKCSKVWNEAYTNALFGWPDEETHRLAEDFRNAA